MRTTRVVACETILIVAYGVAVIYRRDLTKSVMYIYVCEDVTRDRVCVPDNVSVVLIMAQCVSFE